MPNAPKTPIRQIRLDDELWGRFGEVAKPDRSTVIRDFVRWYVHESGARAPKRPPRSESSTS